MAFVGDLCLLHVPLGIGKRVSRAHPSMADVWFLYSVAAVVCVCVGPLCKRHVRKKGSTLIT